MKIDLLRTAHPLEVDWKTILKVKKKLKEDNTTSEEKIREIFSQIDVEIDLDEMIN